MPHKNRENYVIANMEMLLFKNKAEGVGFATF